MAGYSNELRNAMTALADESIFDKIRRFQSDMRANNWGDMPEGYAIPENPNYGYLVDTQNAMRAALVPYLERFGLALPDTRPGSSEGFYDPMLGGSGGQDYYTPPLNAPGFSVNYMTNAPRLFGGRKQK